MYSSYLAMIQGILLLFLATSLSIVVLYVVYRFVWVPYVWIWYFRKRGIPGELFVPFVGQLPDIARVQGDDHSDFWAYENSLIQKHGPVFYYCKGPEFRLCFHDSDVLKQVYTEYSSFDKLPVAKQAVEISLASKGFMFSDYADWKRQRRRYNVAFQHSNLETMFHSMAQICQETLDKWERTQGNIDMTTEFGKLTLEIVVYAAFGQRNTKSPEMKRTSNKVRQVMNLIQEYFRSGLAFLPGSSFLITRFDSRVRSYHTAGKKFLQNLITRRVPDSSLAAVLKEHAAERPDEALANALTLLQAGHETTASALCFVLFLLDKNPKWWDALRKEVFSVCGIDQPPTKDQAWGKLPICSAVVNETLRLFPPLPQLSRISSETQEIEYNGHKIELSAGTPVIASIVAGHRDPRVWKNPNCFDPNHFLKKAIPDVYVPFSAGGRNCIGRYFAQLELRFILATLAQRVHMRLPPTYKLCTQNSGLTLRVKYGMPVRVQKLTTEEIEYWFALGKSSTEEDRLAEANNIQVGPPLWETCTPQTQCQLTRDAKKGNWPIILRPAPCSTSYTGVRTPCMFRVLLLVAYAQLVREGAMLLFLVNDSAGMRYHTYVGIWLYTGVYCVETFFALGFHWISMQGVHMLHMYEHHLTGFVVGMALCIHTVLCPGSWTDFIFDICHLPLSIGFFAQLCEVFAIVRTFLPDPDHYVCELVRRGIGAVLMTALSVSILKACLIYAYTITWQGSAFKWTEACTILTAAYLAILVQPKYVLSHVKAIQFVLVKPNR